MEFILYGIYIFLLTIFYNLFFNFRLSIALYISYLILVPYIDFRIGGLTLSYNIVEIIILFVFFFHFKKLKRAKLNFELIIPFLILFGALLFISLFTTEVPFNVQINSWRMVFLKTCIMTFIIWNTSLHDPKLLNYIKWSLIISVTIAGLYAILLTQLHGVNVYTSFLANYLQKNDVADVYANAVESRLSFSTAGKIQATMIHPMTWTFLLCLSFVIFLNHYLEKKNKIYLLLLSFIVFSILISGVRTGIGAVVIGYIYFLLRYRKLKIIFSSLLILMLLSVVVQSNKNLSNIFSSFVDVKGKNSEMNGSSIGLRLTQLDGALKEIENSPLVGKGFSWNGYYQMTRGDHPVLLAFESLIFIVLCNSGFIGLVIWILFFLYLLHLHRKLLRAKKDIYMLDFLVIIYLSYAIGTGEYGYLAIFGMFYAYLFAQFYNERVYKLREFKILK